ncbi:Hypothetical protein FKW44_009873 [Caligus rogercresseyi]|uniref:Uncharacterized protein n=1 Tax=Caligus rogercresseyi TaxID=217165 RepID=A0A7T8HFT0_CALRO|nr:Hypothetical protein FKW44_009873 [Caligus rogercresseyi]
MTTLKPDTLELEQPSLNFSISDYNSTTTTPPTVWNSYLYESNERISVLV